MRPGVFVIFALAAFPAGAGPQIAVSPKRQATLRPASDSIRLGADFLLGQQGDYRVEGKRGKVRAGWEWEVGSGAAAPNASGLVAVALLDAFKVTNDPAHLAAAEAYAGRLARMLAKSPEWRPYKPDIELLGRIYAQSGDERWRAAAEDAFRRVRAVAPGGKAELQRLIGVREGSGLVGYDAALGVRAALAVGEMAWAAELLDAAIAASGLSWGRADDTHRLVSWGALLDVAARVDRARYAKAIALLAEGLRLKQGAEGSWAQRETQATAYAVLGLQAAGDPVSRAAAQRGAAWLRRTQLRAGGWADYNDGLPEPFVGAVLSEPAAEAIQALARVER
jgi:hypothetical protein